jgi:hypothetical protein
VVHGVKRRTGRAVTWATKSNAAIMQLVSG